MSEELDPRSARDFLRVLKQLPEGITLHYKCDAGGGRKFTMNWTYINHQLHFNCQHEGYPEDKEWLPIDELDALDAIDKNFGMLVDDDPPA